MDLFNKNKINVLQDEIVELKQKIHLLESKNELLKDENQKNNNALLKEKEILEKDIQSLSEQKEDLSKKKEKLDTQIENRIKFWFYHEFNYIDGLAAKGQMFEEYVCDLFTLLGKKAEITPGSGDRGVDIIVYDGDDKIAVQCKCYSENVSNDAVQEVYSGKDFYKCNKARVITNNYFTDRAIEIAEVNNVELIDRVGLEELIRKAYLSYEEYIDNIFE